MFTCARHMYGFRLSQFAVSFDKCRTIVAVVIDAASDATANKDAQLQCPPKDEEDLDYPRA